MASYTNFCCRAAAGDNRNAGTLTGDTTVPNATPSFEYTSGDWVQSTRVFTLASGNPQSDGVAVGDMASVYVDAASVTGFVGRVTAVDSTTITLSGSENFGSSPSDSTGGMSIRIGGAWAGPNGTVGFPWSVINNDIKNTSNHPMRINFQGTFTITAAITLGNFDAGNGITYEGFSSAYADGGRATLTATGASFTMLDATLNNQTMKNFIFGPNGTSNNGGSCVTLRANNMAFWVNCTFKESYGYGMTHVGGDLLFCDVHSNALYGIESHTNRHCLMYGCNVYDNGSHGVAVGSGSVYTLVSCVAHNNGGDGFNISNPTMINCDSYNNSGDGLQISGQSALIAASNFLNNGAYGIDGAVNFLSGEIRYCGFGAGTEANTSGATTDVGNYEVIGTVTYANDVNPYVDAANGDFQIEAGSDAVGAAGFEIPQDSSAYSAGNIVSSRDIGAAQHEEGAVGGGTAKAYGIQPIDSGVF